MFRNSMYSSRLSASEPKGGGAFRSELDGTVNLPGVGGVEWVEERRRLAGDVPQLDVFIQVVGVGTEGRRGVQIGIGRHRESARCWWGRVGRRAAPPGR